MTTSPLEVKQTLADLVAAVPELAGVKVHTSTRTTVDLVPDYLVLGDISGTDTPLSMGGGQLSMYTIECESKFKAANTKEAFDRAWEVKHLIAQVLAHNPTVNSTVLDAQIGKWTIEETIDADDGRTATLELEIDIQDRN